jgi:hypothetical protein
MSSGKGSRLPTIRCVIGVIWALSAALLTSGCGGGSSAPLTLQGRGSVTAYARQGASDGLTCDAASGVGTAGIADVNYVVPACSEKFHTLGGTISGLTQSRLVLANGANIVTVAANTTTFMFPTPVTYAKRYAVIVVSQPAGLICLVSNGSGPMPASDVTTVKVTCLDNADPVRATARDFNATGLVLFLALARSARSRF